MSVIAFYCFIKLCFWSIFLYLEVIDFLLVIDLLNFLLMYKLSVKKNYFQFRNASHAALPWKLHRKCPSCGKEVWLGKSLKDRVPKGKTNLTDQKNINGRVVTLFCIYICMVGYFQTLLIVTCYHFK